MPNSERQQSSIWSNVVCVLVNSSTDHIKLQRPTILEASFLGFLIPTGSPIECNRPTRTINSRNSSIPSPVRAAASKIQKSVLQCPWNKVLMKKERTRCFHVGASSNFRSHRFTLCMGNHSFISLSHFLYLNGKKNWMKITGRGAERTVSLEPWRSQSGGQIWFQLEFSSQKLSGAPLRATSSVLCCGRSLGWRSRSKWGKHLSAGMSTAVDDRILLYRQYLRNIVDNWVSGKRVEARSQKQTNPRRTQILPGPPIQALYCDNRKLKRNSGS
jgi:hypothetical protein